MEPNTSSLESISQKIDIALQNLLNHLQSERDRLCEKVKHIEKNGNKPSTAMFVKSDEFETLLENFLTVPIVTDSDLVKSEEQQAQIMRPEKAGGSSGVEVAVEVTVAVGSRDFKVTATFKGFDAFGEPIKIISSVAAIPSLGAFAVLHNESKISLLSPWGEVKATFVVGSVTSNFSPIGTIRTNPIVPNQLIVCQDRQIKTINLPDPVLKSSTVFAESKTALDPICKVSPDFVISKEHGLLYLFQGRYIFCYSLMDWGLVQTIQLQSLQSFSRALGFNNDKLYYKSKVDSILYTIPVNSTGIPLREQSQIMFSKFEMLRNIAFDDRGNILTVDPARKASIELLSPAGEVLRKLKTESTAYPCEITSLNVFDEHSRVMCTYAVVDCANNKVMFFV